MSQQKNKTRNTIFPRKCRNTRGVLPVFQTQNHETINHESNYSTNHIIHIFDYSISQERIFNPIHPLFLHSATKKHCLLVLLPMCHVTNFILFHYFPILPNTLIQPLFLQLLIRFNSPKHISTFFLIHFSAQYFIKILCHTTYYQLQVKFSVLLLLFFLSFKPMVLNLR